MSALIGDRALQESDTVKLSAMPMPEEAELTDFPTMEQKRIEEWMRENQVRRVEFVNPLPFARRCLQIRLG